ncbi:gluconokinase [Teredinibacter franksiae]|uniref:gluconokinase n=1 Tax=Teredinibacter franksiae TaxID=2761453 RepID=UPI0016257763|nr:gluconokinase, GntK/IdnK-type [Teredinibacter franksiae]
MINTTQKYDFSTLKGKPLALVVMGVSGCGKTTLATTLESAIGLQAFDADDFHCAANKAHMASGHPLTDSMREPWVKEIREHLEYLAQQNRSCALAFSGLRRDHRNALRVGCSTVRFLFLEGSRELIHSRMKARSQHFMPLSLLDSQFETLDYPAIDETDLLKLDIHKPIANLVDSVVSWLQQEGILQAYGVK